MNRREILPVTCLISQMLLIGVFVSRYEPHSVGDTASYVDFRMDSLEAAFSQIRTPGYPLFLQAVRTFSPDLSAVPLCQYGVWCMATACFWWGLRKLSSNAWRSSLLSCVLLYCNILHDHVNTVATDTIAAAAGIAVCGCLIGWLAMGERSFSLLLSMGLLVLTACLIRPACLFLVPMLPITASLLAGIRDGRFAGIKAWRTGVRLLPVVSLPVLSYCLLRWLVVGHFGLVSFGGYSFVGLAGQWVDATVIPQLSEELQPLAQLALTRKQQYESEHPLAIESGPGQYMRLEQRFDSTIYQAFAPAASELFGNNVLKANEALGKLAGEVIQLRLRNYAIWVAKASRQAVRITALDLMSNPVAILLLLIAFVLQLVTFRGQRGGAGPECLPIRSDEIADRRESIKVSETVWILAGSYLLFSTLLVVVVCPPYGRYMDANAVLLPVLLVDLVWQKASQVYTLFSRKQS